MRIGSIRVSAHPALGKLSAPERNPPARNDHLLASRPSMVQIPLSRGGENSFVEQLSDDELDFDDSEERLARQTVLVNTTAGGNTSLKAVDRSLQSRVTSQEAGKAAKKPTSLSTLRHISFEDRSKQGKPLRTDNWGDRRLRIDHLLKVARRQSIPADIAMTKMTGRQHESKLAKLRKELAKEQAGTKVLPRFSPSRRP